MSSITALKRKVHRILEKSYDWMAWYTALENAFFLERTPFLDRNIVFCVDTSEVIEYLLPRSLTRQKKRPYPTPSDLSLLILFKPKQRLFILPPHLRELQSLSGLWGERLRMAAQRLRTFEVGIKENKRIEKLDRVADDEGALDQFIDSLLRDRGFFSQIFGLAPKGGKSLEAFASRLEVPDQSHLGLEGWLYRPDPDRIDFLYSKLSDSKVAHGGPSSHLIDAHALHMVELINEALPDNTYLVLLTQSGKIWEVIDAQREAEPRMLLKNGVSLVMLPQVALVKRLLQEPADSPDVGMRERLILEQERSRSLRDLRKRLTREILPFLEEGVETFNLGAETFNLTTVEQLVTELDSGIDQLDSVSQDRQRLERIRLALDPGEEEQEGILGQFLKAIRGNRREEMREVLSRRLEELIEQVHDLQQRLSLAVVTTPSSPWSLESLGEEEPSYGIRGILSSQPGGRVYSIRFQSLAVNRHLRTIQLLLEKLDEARGDNDLQKKGEYDLRREMYLCEVHLGSEIEYNLLLAFVFSSRQMWFQAFDAADQGLKKIWGREIQPDSSAPDRMTASATVEFLLAQAFAFTNWTLERHADLPVVTATFLGMAARWVRQSLHFQEQWAATLFLDGGPDPRCLRELGTIYGTAREAGIPLKVHREDCTIAGIPNEHEPSLLDLFLAFAQIAYTRGREDALMKVYYENSLLYALTEKDDPKDLEQRLELAQSLEQEPAVNSDPNFLDTLAWHHFHIFQRHRQRGDSGEESEKKALKFIEMAYEKVRKNNLYYRGLIERHRDQIRQVAANDSLLLS